MDHFLLCNLYLCSSTVSRLGAIGLRPIGGACLWDPNKSNYPGFPKASAVILSTMIRRASDYRERCMQVVKSPDRIAAGSLRFAGHEGEGAGPSLSPSALVFLPQPSAYPVSPPSHSPCLPVVLSLQKTIPNDAQPSPRGIPPRPCLCGTRHYRARVACAKQLEKSVRL